MKNSLWNLARGLAPSSEMPLPVDPMSIALPSSQYGVLFLSKSFALLMLVQIKDGKLSYKGQTAFFADQPPKGRRQSNVYASQGGRPIEIEIAWASK